MSTQIKRTRLLITILVGLLLTLGTILAIQFAKGYRPNLSQLTISGTGLLSATSYPRSAQVFISDRLTTVTDDTLNLTPGEYQIKIIKTGFYPWSKTISIKPELVTTTDARLFPTIPSTTPLTFYQVKNTALSPDGSKLAYVLTGSPFVQENGVYILSLSGNLLINNQIIQIANLSVYDYTQTEFLWSPDNSQLLAVFSDKQKVTASHILNPKILNQTKGLIDTTIRLPLLLSSWQEQLATVNKNNLNRFPSLITQIATSSAVNVYFSPDREKILYTSTIDQGLPEILSKTTMPSTNQSQQTRNLEKGKTYVYDLKEDRNFTINQAKYDPQTAVKLLTTSISPNQVSNILAQIQLLRGQTDALSTQNLTWYSTSRHLLITSRENVSAIEYDDHNLTPIFSAPIAQLAVPSPDGSRLIILTSFNQKPDTNNLLSLDLK